VAALALIAVAAPAASASPTYRGVQVHSMWYTVSNQDMIHELDLVHQSGANVIRADVSWASLEYAKGQYDATYLAKLDSMVAAADARGIKVIVTLWETPCWASSAPDSVKQSCSGAWWNRGVNYYPPVRATDFGAAAGMITHRYSTKLAALEIWNEPQHAGNLTAPDVAAAYAELVRGTYAQAKAGDPNVDVLAGSLAYADVPFLQRLYANGIKGNYDGLSIHPYSDGRAPSDVGQASYRAQTFAGGISWFHDTEQANGDQAPIWVTEFGWTTCSVSGCSSEQQQADYTVQAFRLLDGVPYVKGATIYQLRDSSSNAANPEANFGLLHSDFSPRPAWAAFRSAMGGGSATSPSSGQAGSSPTGTATTKPTTGSSTAAKPARRTAHRLTMRLRRRHGAVVARGSSAARGLVRIVVLRRGANRRAGGWYVMRRLAVRTSRNGSFRAHIGTLRQVRGCRVVAHLGRATVRPAAVS
jgi:hypothetical protein